MLPIFPLAGAIVLPRAQLPLNIFEPRYLNMVFDALGSHRMIGMVQPNTANQDEGAKATVYKVGCAGRITAFNEIEDCRLLIILTGVCRFEITEELAVQRGYRRVIPDWQPFAGDLSDTESLEVDLSFFYELLQNYFQAHEIQADWQSIKRMPGRLLVNYLAMNMPFDPWEKQALMEARTLSDRTRTLIALFEMSLSSHPGQNKVRH
jgi:hypothetical protein